MIDEKEELEQLKIWKEIFDSPYHQMVKNNKIIHAQIGLIPEVNKPVSYNNRLNAKTVKDAGYLGGFPLILVEHRDEGNKVTVINERFKDRSIYTDFVELKRGFISKKYYEEYANDK